MDRVVTEEWFLGEHQLTLDAKGRVILPRAYRSLLGAGAVLTKGTDRCLAIYPKDQFREVAMQRLALAREGSRSRQAARFVFTKATPVDPDTQGRIAIPAGLRDYAGLAREVVVAGVYDHVEIWDAHRYGESEATGDEELDQQENVPM